MRKDFLFRAVSNKVHRNDCAGFLWMNGCRGSRQRGLDSDGRGKGECEECGNKFHKRGVRR